MDIVITDVKDFAATITAVAKYGITAHAGIYNINGVDTPGMLLDRPAMQNLQNDESMTLLIAITLTGANVTIGI